MATGAAREYVTFEGAPGERVLWEGRPHGIRGFLRPMDLFFLTFALFAGLFFLSTSVAIERRAGEGFTPLSVFLFPIVFFGLFLLGPRVIGMLRESAGAAYAVTDRRVVIRNRGRLVDLDLATMNYLELDSSWLSGRTIFFGQRLMYEGWGGFYGPPPAPAFRGLPDADEVYRIIRDARDKARQR